MTRNKSVFFILALVSALGLLYCQGPLHTGLENTDLAAVSDINSMISDADLAGGVSKTRNFMGTVMMSHVEHERAGVNCFSCHHREGNDGRLKQCASCHKGESGRDTMHNLCVGCHLEQGRGAMLCGDCHAPDERQK